MVVHAYEERMDLVIIVMSKIGIVVVWIVFNDLLDSVFERHYAQS